MTENRDLFNAAPEALACAVCGSQFECPVRSRRLFCSDECKRVRSQRRSAAYHQLGRDLRADLLKRMGDWRPPHVEFFIPTEPKEKP